MSYFKAVFFDLDGTILNTIDDIADAMNSSLRQINVDTIATVEFNHLVGSGFSVLVSRVINYLELNENIHDKLLELYKKNYEAMQFNKTSVYNNVEPLLTKLKEDNIYIMVVTNKNHQIAQETLNYFLPNIEFDGIRGIVDYDDVKPNPKLVHELIDEFALYEDECLFVGDTDIDIITGINANVATVGVTWGFREEDELIQAGANYIIHDPLALIDIINNNY